MKLKYQIPTSLYYTYPNIMRYIALVGLSIAILVTPSSALKAPNEYGTNQCELIAKDYQNVYGGSLIWIQPLKDNGAFDLGEYNAHIINKVGNNYTDYQTGFTTKSLNSVQMWYEWEFGKKAVIYDLSNERPEFGMVWHY